MTMPVLFVGHGSPMNAIQTNDFTRALNAAGAALPRPQAILCLSAHWLTRGETRVLSGAEPAMIYDMFGFPDALYHVSYPARGEPRVAAAIADGVDEPSVISDSTRGFDHGNWAIMRHLLPAADVPVLQLSIDYDKPFAWHYALAGKLARLRDEGVLIVGSGNITHNLSRIDMGNPHAPPLDWAIDFDETITALLDAHDHDGIIDITTTDAAAAKLAHPEPSHYLPLLYVIGAQRDTEQPQYFHSGIEHGSLSMRCFRFG